MRASSIPKIRTSQRPSKLIGIGIDLGAPKDFGRKRLGDDVMVARLGPISFRCRLHPIQTVLDLWRIADRAIPRNSPRCGRPNNDERLFENAIPFVDIFALESCSGLES